MASAMSDLRLPS